MKSKKSKKARPVSKELNYGPGIVLRDFILIVAEDAPEDQIEQAVEQLAGVLIYSLNRMN